MNIDIKKLDDYNALNAAAFLRRFCNYRACQECPFHCAGDCTLRSSAPDAWTSEDWRSPEDI